MKLQDSGPLPFSQRIGRFVTFGNSEQSIAVAYWAGTVKRRLQKYGLYFLAWTAVALFFFSQDLTRKLMWRDPTPWWHYLVSWGVGIYICALLTPLTLWLGRRFPIERRTWHHRIPLHLLFGIVFAFIDLAVVSAVVPRFGILPAMMSRGFRDVFQVLLVISFHGTLLTYWIVLGIQHAIRNYRKFQEREQQALRLELHASELQSQLMRAHLSTLKMQLQPHFLFNTLNAIMVLVRQHKVREAEEMLARLSDLLRCVLEDVEAQEVPLRRELEYVQLYLAIEQVRFQDRLRVEYSVDPAVMDAAVPHMCLQPIVENAIRHGIGRSSAAGKVGIRASRTDESLEVEVRDDGPGLPPESSAQGRGIGLANTRARLNQLYGDAAQLTVANGDETGVVVTITLPYRVAPGFPETELMELHALDSVDR